MAYISIRFMIGLGDPSDPRSRKSEEMPREATEQDRVYFRKQLAMDKLRTVYEQGDFKPGRGVWRGTFEESLIFETIQEDSAQMRQDAQGYARALALSLGQDAVALAIAPTDFYLIGQDGNQVPSPEPPSDPSRG